MNEEIPPQTPPSSEKKYGVHVNSPQLRNKLKWRLA